MIRYKNIVFDNKMITTGGRLIDSYHDLKTCCVQTTDYDDKQDWARQGWRVWGVDHKMSYNRHRLLFRGQSPPTPSNLVVVRLHRPVYVGPWYRQPAKDPMILHFINNLYHNL